MASTEELWDGLTGGINFKTGRSSIEVPYLITDAADEAAMIAEASASIPALFLGVLPLQGITLEEHVEETTWRVIAQYESTGIDTAGGGEVSSFNFDTGGGTFHLLQTKNPTIAYGPPPTIPVTPIPKTGGAIGYDGEHIQGVDISIPVYSFQETHYLPVATVTTAYKKTLADLTAKVNDASFKGFPAGEVIFLGASGSRRNEEKWAITYRFAREPNEIDIIVGHDLPAAEKITGIAKEGWQYMWARYVDVVKDARKVKLPIAVYVETIYDSASFSGLGIGT